MAIDPSNSLSQEAVALIESLLSPSSATAPKTVDDAMVLRFALGGSEPDEQDRVIDALTRSSQLRRQLIEYRKEANTIRAVPWSKAIEEFRGSRVLENILQAANDTLQSCRDLAQGLKEKQTRVATQAPNEWKKLGVWLSSSIGPPQIAVTRSEGVSYQVAEISGTVTIEITTEGALFASFRPTETTGWSTRKLALDFVDPAGIVVRLGETFTGDSSWEIEFPGIGIDLGLAPGSISIGNFRVVESDQEFIETLLWVPEKNNETEFSGFRQIRPIEVKGSTLSISMRPTAVTVSRYPNGRLEAYLETTSGPLLIDSWPVSDLLQSDAVTTTAPGLVLLDALPPMAIQFRISK